MLIEFDAHRVHVKAPAKINLYLEILGKRADGFHELRSVLCPVALCDDLVLELDTQRGGAAEVSLTVQLPSHDPADPAWQVPNDESNLAVRGVRLVQQRLGMPGRVRLALTKRIPAAAGLGGGSSDAAAAVVAALIAWRSWDRSLAHEICAQLGSDVPFFLGSPQGIGLALPPGRAEICQPLPHKPPLRILLSHPPAGCPTHEVYAALKTPPPAGHFNDFIAACETGQTQKIGAQLFNALQSSAMRLNDWIETQLQLYARSGAEYALMTGSGSSCYTLLEGRAVEPRFRSLARLAGLERVHSVQAWYADSIEQQLRMRVG